MSNGNKSPNEIRTGGCFCGAVKYVVSGAPINVRVCHCQDCQRLTGSAFFVRALFPRAAVTIPGQLAEFHSSADLTRKFCPRYGSQTFAERKRRANTIAITLGSFDNLEGICPSDHIWVSDKQQWLCHCETDIGEIKYQAFQFVAPPLRIIEVTHCLISRFYRRQAAQRGGVCVRFPSGRQVMRTAPCTGRRRTSARPCGTVPRPTAPSAGRAPVRQL